MTQGYLVTAQRRWRRWAFVIHQPDFAPYVSAYRYATEHVAMARGTFATAFLAAIDTEEAS